MCKVHKVPLRLTPVMPCQARYQLGSKCIKSRYRGVSWVCIQILLLLFTDMIHSKISLFSVIAMDNQRYLDYIPIENSLQHKTFCFYNKPTKPHLHQGKLCPQKLYVGWCHFQVPRQNLRVVILPHLIQKCQTAQVCLRTVRGCLVTKDAAYLGATLMFGLSSIMEQPMQIPAFINFPAHLAKQEVIGLRREET